MKMQGYTSAHGHVRRGVLAAFLPGLLCMCTLLSWFPTADATGGASLAPSAPGYRESQLEGSLRPQVEDNGLTSRSMVLVVGDLRITLSTSRWTLQVEDAVTGELLLSQSKQFNGLISMGLYKELFDLGFLYEGYQIRVGSNLIWSHADEIESVTVDPESGNVTCSVRMHGLYARGVLRVTLHSFQRRQFSVSVRPSDSLFGKFNRISLGFDSPESEGFYGLGMRYTATNQRGRRVNAWSEEGSWSFGRLAPTSAVLRYPKGKGATYFPVPFFLSSLGYGFEIDSNYETHFDFASKGIFGTVFCAAVFVGFFLATLRSIHAIGAVALPRDRRSHKESADGGDVERDVTFMHGDGIIGVDIPTTACDTVFRGMGRCLLTPIRLLSACCCKCCCKCFRLVPSFGVLVAVYTVLLAARILLGFTDVLSSAPDLQFCIAAATYFALTRHTTQPSTLFVVVAFAAALSFGIAGGRAIDRNLITMVTESDATDMNLYFGETPSQSLRMFTDKTGRYPVPTKWLFGPWYMLRGSSIEEKPFGMSGADAAEAFVRRDIPLAQMMREVQFLPERPYDNQLDAIRAENAKYHSLGVKTTCYFNNFVHSRAFNNHSLAVYDEARRLGLLTKNKTGDPFSMHFHIGLEGAVIYIGGEQVAQFDFSNPAAVAFYQGLLLFAADLGYDGWKYDYGEYTPPDSLSFDGTPGDAMHNLYPVLYQQAAQSLFERIDANKTRPGYGPDHVFFVRSGYTGSQGVTPAVWTGDSCSDWTKAFGLPAHLVAMLNLGLSGVPVSGSDASGFVWILQPPPSFELNVRWVQLAAFSGLSEYMAGGFGLGAKTRILDTPAGVALYRRYAKLRTQLFPHIYAAAHEARDFGLPIMRHHLLDFPRDANALAVGSTQFMFGRGLLVAPVVESGLTTRRVYLPYVATSGAVWHDVSTRLQYDETDGRFRIARAAATAGKTAATYPPGTFVTVPAPLDSIPLFALGGTAVFLLDPAVDTVNDDIATSPLVTTMAQRAHVLHAWVWPNAFGVAAGVSYDGASLSVAPVVSNNSAPGAAVALQVRLENDSVPGRSIVAQTSVAVIPGATLSVEGIAMSASWRNVSGDAAAVPSWFYDADAGTLWTRQSMEYPLLLVECTVNAGVGGFSVANGAPCMSFV
eukprot:Opistho-2@20967